MQLPRQRLRHFLRPSILRSTHTRILSLTCFAAVCRYAEGLKGTVRFQRNLGRESPRGAVVLPDENADDVETASHALQNLSALSDHWKTTCSAQASAEEGDLERAQRVLAHAQSRVGSILAGITRARAELQELITKKSNLATQCSTHMVLCDRYLERRHLERKSIRANRKSARQVARKAFDEDENTSATSSLRKVRRSLRGQAANATNATKQQREACIAQVAIIDDQLIAIHSQNATAVGTLRFLLIDQEKAEDVQRQAEADINQLRNQSLVNSNWCKQALANITNRSEVLQARRAELMPDGMIASDCEVSEWNPSFPGGRCSKSCGGGVRAVEREVLNQPSNGGFECPQLLAKNITCNPHPCPVDCQVSTWAEWSECSSTCRGGVRYRRRTVGQATVGSGTLCGLLSEMEECNGGLECGNGCAERPRWARNASAETTETNKEDAGRDETGTKQTRTKKDDAERDGGEKRDDNK